jgi:hypothetical protein
MYNERPNGVPFNGVPLNERPNQRPNQRPNKMEPNKEGLNEEEPNDEDPPQYFAYELNQTYANNVIRAFICYNTDEHCYKILVEHDNVVLREPDEYYFRVRSKTKVINSLRTIFSNDFMIECELYKYEAMPVELSFDFLDNWARDCITTSEIIDGKLFESSTCIHIMENDNLRKLLTLLRRTVCS